MGEISELKDNIHGIACKTVRPRSGLCLAWLAVRRAVWPAGCPAGWPRPMCSVWGAPWRAVQAGSYPWPAARVTLPCLCRGGDPRGAPFGGIPTSLPPPNCAPPAGICRAHTPPSAGAEAGRPDKRRGRRLQGVPGHTAPQGQQGGGRPPGKAAGQAGGPQVSPVKRGGGRAALS